MFRVSICILVLTTLTCAALAQTQPAEEGADAPDRRSTLLQRFDTDGDGRLNAEERANARKRLKALGKPAYDPIPQTVHPQTTNLYRLADGQADFDVIKTYTLPGKDGGRSIPMRLTIPKGDDPAPVVILCHGALGSKDGLQALAPYWASHGYIVIQPTFGDSLTLLSEEEKQSFKSLVDLVNSPRTQEHWDDRPREVSHIIDSLGRIENDVRQLAGRLDEDRIAVAGHSFGAHTTMLLAGLTLKRGHRELNFRDERIKASIMISPQGPGNAITRESYKTLAGPLLMITGDNDGTPIKGRENKAGRWRREAFEHCKANEAYLLWIKDAYHGFGGLGGKGQYSGAGPKAPDHVYYVKSTCLAFLDATLGHSDEARTYLAGDQIERETDGKAKLERK